MKIRLKDYFDVLNENYVLICTSNSVEKKAVNKLLRNRCELEPNMETLGCCIGLLADSFVIHLSGESGIGKSKSISRLIISFVSNEGIPKPAKVILSGFCWGNPSKAKVGDILLSSRIISLNHQEITGDSLAYKNTITDSSVNIGSISTEIKKRINNSVIGDLVSLETLYASTERRDALLEHYPEVIGGEMEAFAFVPSMGTTPWLVVKAVSDNADDDFDQNIQEKAARIASESLSAVIEIFTEQNLINLNISTTNNLSLVDRLLGKIIMVSAVELDANNLNDYLNDVVGPQVEYKLKRYVTSDDYDQTFVKYFCDLILETIQNSIKHGEANKIEVTFNDSSIIINDDGNDFELVNLNGDRGGNTAWNRVVNNFIDSGKVVYNYTKKKHKFSLARINSNIINVINNCSVEIVKNKIGSSWASKNILSYDEKCDSVFIDDREIRMQSRRNTMLNEVKQLVESGKIVYVAVNDAEDAEQYISLQLQPDFLKVLIRPL